ncbi:hypothetical protein RJ640_021911 [Escallonia rubra]|uniref:Bifunctional inhibitor/plant lipid transfer protein/seed storage helical domain-containing protein n=1 Tax=Escallonia rubra TaxID=112253 RepID=A0AA88R920_9ASTE|nr:hypothetical protein RJ640_021911 [Escallonia rubra]
MDMKMPCVTFCVVFVLLLGGAHVSMAVTCSALQLSPCASAIMSATTPSPTCCSKIKEQRPCLCKYLKDPNLKKFISSPNAKKARCSNCRNKRVAWPKELNH